MLPNYIYVLCHAISTNKNSYFFEASVVSTYFTATKSVSTYAQALLLWES